MVFRKLYNEPIYKNSFFMILSSFIISIIGFIFWIIAAKFYPASYVGLGTATISVMGLICSFSYFGFDQSIIRFFPDENKNIVLSTSLTVVLSLTLFIGILFLWGIEIWSPNLLILRENSLGFLTVLILTSLVSILGTSLIAIRKTELYFIQNLFTGIRIPLLILLIAFGVFGIIYSIGISFFIVTIISVLFLRYNGIKIVNPSMRFLKESFNFSTGTYLSNIFLTGPALIMPIIILNILGAANAAYYYISFSIASIILIIPSSIAISIFVEGSHGNNLKKRIPKALFLCYTCLILFITFFYFFGESILNFIGKEYIIGNTLIMLIAFSGFFYSIFQINYAIKKINKEIKNMIKINFILFCLILSSSYILIQQFGINGIGYSWIISYVIINLILWLESKF